MVVGREARECKIGEYNDEDVVCASAHIIGNGAYKDITDVIYIDPEHFDISKSNTIAMEIGELNRLLVEEGRKCVLMGFGRLGTSDPWLGIPVVWWQMSQAKVVVEADLENLVVEPSLGSHFHHNLTSLKMGYFHIGRKESREERINWDILRRAPVVKETEHARLVRFDKPLVIKVDGQCNRGVILKQY